MSQKIKSVFLAGLPAIIIATFLVVVVIHGWTEPSSAPPSGNVSAPVNVGPALQYKTGSLILGGLATDYDVYLATLGGNVGIGTTTPQAKLEVAGNIIASPPVASNHVATKGYVDASTGSNSLPTYVIRSTSVTSYNGDLGARAGANDKCQSEFGPDAVMYGTQHINCYTAGSCILEYRIGIESWFDRTGNMPVATTVGWSAGQEGWSHDRNNCLGWVTGEAGYKGGVVYKSGNHIVNFCFQPRAVACAIPK